MDLRYIYKFRKGLMSSTPSAIVLAIGEERLASLVGALVERRGFRAQPVKTGETACRLLQDGAVGAVIDLDREGREVLAHLERNRPELLGQAVVLCWPLEDTHPIPAGVGAVLRKPVDVAAMERTIAICWQDGNQQR
jgi:hypothetical protein